MKKANSDYKVQGVPTTISAVSRVSVKVKETFYTLEYSEERILPPPEQGCDIVKERKALWDAVNTEVDKQVKDVYELYK